MEPVIRAFPDIRSRYLAAAYTRRETALRDLQSRGTAARRDSSQIHPPAPEDGGTVTFDDEWLSSTVTMYFWQGFFRDQMIRARLRLDELGYSGRSISELMEVSEGAVSQWIGDPPHLMSLKLHYEFDAKFHKDLRGHVEVPYWVRALDAFAYSAMRIRRDIFLEGPDIPRLWVQELECLWLVLGSEPWLRARESNGAGARVAAATAVRDLLCPARANWLLSHKALLPNELWHFGERLCQEWNDAVCIAVAETDEKLFGDFK